jgi:transcriptional regulator with XRE-family HTH domain
MATFDTKALRLQTAQHALLNSELARKAKVSPTAMSCAMAGRRVSVRLARRIAKALGCPLESLVARIEPSKGRRAGSAKATAQAAEAVAG